MGTDLYLCQFGYFLLLEVRASVAGCGVIIFYSVFIRRRIASGNVSTIGIKNAGAIRFRVTEMFAATFRALNILKTTKNVARHGLNIGRICNGTFAAITYHGDNIPI